jgi:hypothetical protein
MPRLLAAGCAAAVSLGKNPQEQDNSIVPSAVFLARSDKCKEEREYLESLVSQAPGKNQKDWIARISSEDEIIHFSSWFESCCMDG